MEGDFGPGCVILAESTQVITYFEEIWKECKIAS